MILVIGDASWDLLFEVDRFPGPDEKVFTDTMITDVGGVAVNAAIAARLLGAPVSFLGRFGGDAFAASVRARLEAAGLDLSLCRSEGQLDTPVAIIITDPSGEKRIVLAPSDGMSPAADQLPVPPPSGIVWAHMVAYDLPAALEIARRLAGVPISLDLEPATVPDGDPSRMRPLIEALDTVIVNSHASRLFGGPDRAVSSLFDWGAGVVVLTRGSGGAVCVTRSDRVDVPAPAVDVVDTTGAGDTFAAAYCVARSDGSSPPAATTFAVAAASLSCRGLGPRGSFPTREEIEAVVEQM